MVVVEGNKQHRQWRMFNNSDVEGGDSGVSGNGNCSSGRLKDS